MLSHSFLHQWPCWVDVPGQIKMSSTNSSRSSSPGSSSHPHNAMPLSPVFLAVDRSSFPETKQKSQPWRECQLSTIEDESMQTTTTGWHKVMVVVPLTYDHGSGNLGGHWYASIWREFSGFGAPGAKWDFLRSRLAWISTTCRWIQYIKDF